MNTTPIPMPGTKRLDHDGTWWMYIGRSNHISTMGRWARLRITSEGNLFIAQPIYVGLFSYNKVWKNSHSVIEIGI